MLVLAPGAHSRVAVSARPEHWKGFQTSRPHHMDRKKLFIDYSGAKYDWPAICFPIVFCAAGCYRLRKFLYGEGLDPHADPHGKLKCSPSQGHFHLTHSGSIPAGYSPVVM